MNVKGASVHFIAKSSLLTHHPLLRCPAPPCPHAPAPSFAHKASPFLTHAPIVLHRQGVAPSNLIKPSSHTHCP